jgi:hypothetical protein
MILGDLREGDIDSVFVRREEQKIQGPRMLAAHLRRGRSTHFLQDRLWSRDQALFRCGASKLEVEPCGSLGAPDSR